MKLCTSVLGFPRMGDNRQLKKLVESYWSCEINGEQLSTASDQHYLSLLQIQQSHHIDMITSGDFSLYDHVLDWSVDIGAISTRFQSLNQSDQYSLYFAAARGYQANGVDISACEMKKWYDTNYHYIVPEIRTDQQFVFNDNNKIHHQFCLAKQHGIKTCPVIIGPITYLLLSKISDGNNKVVDINQTVLARLIEQIIPCYKKLLNQLVADGAADIRFDEPHLVMDLPGYVAELYTNTYSQLLGGYSSKNVKFTVSTYFGEVRDNFQLLIDTPHISTIHIDSTRDHNILAVATNALSDVKYSHISLSIGCVDGRNIWKSNLSQLLQLLNGAVSVLGASRVIVASSCSLLHVPHSLNKENKLNAVIRSWLAFAVEKVNEIDLLSQLVGNGFSAVDESIRAQLADNVKCIDERRSSELIHKPSVQQAINRVQDSDFNRSSPYPTRKTIQADALNLPIFPTTTIGSFPQTSHIRALRSKLKTGKIDYDEYIEEIRGEIQKCVELQEKLGIDVLVHGEFERNDMVEYFGELISGYAFTEYGWVQYVISSIYIYIYIYQELLCVVHCTVYN